MVIIKDGCQIFLVLEISRILEKNWTELLGGECTFHPTGSAAGMTLELLGNQQLSLHVIFDVPKSLLVCRPGFKTVVVERLCVQVLSRVQG